MWKSVAALIAVLIAIFIGFNFIGTDQADKTDIIDSGPANNTNVKINMTIESPAFQNNQNILSKFTCDGANVNPPLKISGVPENAKSLALIIDDPDAVGIPTGGTWTHWVLANIASSTSEISENSVPAGAAELKSSFAKPRYGGPCPPSGTHRYFFKLYALDIPKINSADEIPAHTVAQAELIGLYGRQR